MNAFAVGNGYLSAGRNRFLCGGGPCVRTDFHLAFEITGVDIHYDYAVPPDERFGYRRGRRFRASEFTIDLYGQQGNWNT